MFHYGIMQGRLTEPKGRGIQFFPFENWENEFFLAKELQLDEIEFIFDYERYEENPLWSKEGTERIRQIIEETGVVVSSVCFDYFMRRAFYKRTGEEWENLRAENKKVMKRILDAMYEIGASLLEIPLVDDSSMKTEVEKQNFMEFLIEIADGTDASFLFGLETDLPPEKFKEYLDRIHHPRIGANYDSGNSSGLGYNPYEEVTILRDKIYNIHIKDRVLHGSTVALGTGSADFERFFHGLAEIKYQGSFILQAARAEEGEESDNISRQLSFVKEYVKKYLL